ncbi:hypothetical protein K469DRAFT_683526 [Zopfia rhizophila CBS 207.26]|uniref:Uncharacterized protein n=1 Tax=Zopfia rhizophila CBS 207.26 TaxID=1314779 RepID=A0A6A6D981_9PEZI|nr:hypothetical protein K469DRAFT_683526 [Zopfia rhizophila CBS 207.26]
MPHHQQFVDRVRLVVDDDSPQVINGVHKRGHVQSSNSARKRFAEHPGSTAFHVSCNVVPWAVVKYPERIEHAAASSGGQLSQYLISESFPDNLHIYVTMLFMGINSKIFHPVFKQLEAMDAFRGQNNLLQDTTGFEAFVENCPNLRGLIQKRWQINTSQTLLGIICAIDLLSRARTQPIDPVSHGIPCQFQLSPKVYGRTAKEVLQIVNCGVCCGNCDGMYHGMYH